MGTNDDRPVLEFKAATAVGALAAGAEPVADDPLRFQIIGGVTGIVDEVGDVVEPGAYTETLKKRRPKIIKDHEWSRRLGRSISTKELMPGDPGLPAEIAPGVPWPQEAGALVSDVRLFDTREGREAAERWREDDAQQFSIGYIARKALRGTKAGVKRRLQTLDLYEISDVLWGAMPAAGVMPTALATKMLAVDDAAAEAEDDEAIAEAADADDAEQRAAAADEPGDQSAETPDDEDAVHADGLADLDWAEVDAAPTGEPEVKRSFSDFQREQAAKKGQAMGDGSFPIANASDLANAIQALGRAKDVAKARRHIIARARALDLTDKLPKGWLESKAWTEVDEALAALADGGDTEFTEVKDAVADIEGKAGVPGIADTPGDAASVARLKEWYEKGGGAAQIRWGTPGDFMRCVRIAEKHMTPERAKGFCNLRHQGAVGVPPGQEGKVAATWDDATGIITLDLSGVTIHSGQTFTTTSTGGTIDVKVINPEPVPAEAPVDEALTRADQTPPPGTTPVDQNPPAGWEPVDEPRPVRAERKDLDLPWLAGSIEERGALLRKALVEALPGSHVEATYDDHVIASTVDPEGTATWLVPYSVDDEVGAVDVGDPEEVRLVVVADDGTSTDAEAYGDESPADFDMVAGGAEVAVKALATAMETKAGRVLSSSNESRLRAAVEHLLGVLKAAGIGVEPDSDGVNSAATQPVTDTTARPGADTVQTKARVTPAHVAATLARLHADIDGEQD